MRGVTHAWAGVTVAMATSVAFNVDPATAAFGVAVSLAAASLPDMITAIVPFVKLRTFEGHRGVSHWLLAALATTILVYFVKPGLWMYWLYGYLSHLLLDVITTTGLYLLGPLPWIIRLGTCRNGGMVDQLLEAVLPWVNLVLLAVCVLQWIWSLGG